jgi:modulator of FtsH protease
MERNLNPVTYGGVASRGQVAVAVDSNRVLRNTYWLLALSLLPTVVGAFAGMQVDWRTLYTEHPIATPLLMIAAMFGSLFVVTALRNSAWGVAALFGFTFICGAVLGPMLTVAAGLRNGTQIVALAGGMTAAIFFAMAAIATVSKRDFSMLGKFLMVGVVLLVVASIANMFFLIPAVSLTISAIAVLVFSLLILFDVQRIIRGGETNYVMATLSLYLDLYNVFVSLLNLLMAFTGERD